MDAEHADPRPASRVPLPRITRRDVLCVGPLLAIGIYRYAGAGLTPLLIGTRPLLLSALRGTGTAIVTVGAFARVGRAPLWLGLLAPIPILFIDDPFWYWAGRRYGRQILHQLSRTTARTRRRIAWGERLFARYGFWAILVGNLPFVPAPVTLFYLAAGEAGMSVPLFLLADMLGILLFVGFFIGIGWWAGQSAVGVAEGISRYGWWMTGATIALAVAYAIWSTRGQLRPGVPDGDEEAAPSPRWPGPSRGGNGQEQGPGEPE